MWYGAEEPLSAGSSCLLGSLNLSEFVNTETKLFDFQQFALAIRIAVRALNDVLDEGLPLHPLEIQRKSVRDWRSIGLGVMGIADMLIKMEVVYGSPTSITICKTISRALANIAFHESAMLAKEYGMYPNCRKEAIIKSEYFNYIASEETKQVVEQYGLRNNQILTIAPTGTLSTLLEISGGIEPIFAMKYNRTTKSLHNEDVTYTVYTKIAQEWIQKHNSDKLPEFFIESRNIRWQDRIAMQAIWQQAIDASISSTINLPESATIDDIYHIYMEAWKQGLKGCTIFRENCKRIAILSTDKPKEEPKTQQSVIKKVSDDCVGKKRTLVSGCGTLHLLAYFDGETGQLLETYFAKGSQGGCANFMVGLSRMVSLAARGGVPIEAIVDQLKSSGTCPSYAVRRATKNDVSKGSCCPVAIGNALMDMYNEMQAELKPRQTKEEKKEETVVTNKCPECGEPLVATNGCFSCNSCGYSRCG